MSSRRTILTESGTDLIDVTVLLEKFLKSLKKRWPVVLICIMLFCGYFAAMEYRRYTPSYTSSVTFTISPAPGVLGNSTYIGRTTADQMAETFPHILNSGLLRRRVAEDLGLSTVPGNIRASVVKDTNLFVISVTTGDAQLSFDIIESLVKIYPTISDLIIGDTQMRRLDETGVARYPDRALSYTGAIKSGVLYGGILGLAWVVIRMLGRKTILREDDLRQMVNIPCIGVIPKANKGRNKKEDIVLTNRRLDAKIAEAFLMVRNKVEFETEQDTSKVILVTSALPEEGKSTVAVNLALALAQNHKNVTLIDCDLRNPSVRGILRIPGEKGLSDVLLKRLKKGEKVYYKKILDKETDNILRILPGGVGLNDGSELLGTDLMKNLIEHLRSKNDYVIVDSAPAGFLTDAVVLSQFVDSVIFVIRKDYAGVGHILEGMEQLTRNPVRMVGCVFNDF